ncbi:blue copper protein-like [Momordica charantia]|uniref:Blue copper protein-like n=1 Tax=Momordica charantia TaxID=3673 RepID=A0A6J1CPZ0_MOMCH|nr:blue copper protein-like [Momordica charantia]
MAVRFNQMAVLLLLTAAALWQRSSAATYVVGDSLGWTVPPNPTSYSDWASTKTFVVGDVLVFNFASGRHDVAEVTRSGFDTCSGGNPISVENNSPARITLTSAGDHHFICNFPGHCNGGQKLSVTVRATASPAPTAVPVPGPSRSPSPAPAAVPVPRPSRSPSPAPTAVPVPGPSQSPSSSVVPSPAPSREPMTYVVGDSSGWTVPSSASFYESWARDKSFFVGDVLEFNFAIQTHDVAEVTRENFDRCSGESPRSPISTNPPVRITLSEAGEHFFICTFAGHCGVGQKLAVNVTGGGASSPPSNTDPSNLSPTTAPPPPSAASSLRASAFSAALLAVALALVY